MDFVLKNESLLARGRGDKILPMLQTVVDANPADKTATARDTMLAAYRFMLRARLLDDKFAALYRAGKIHGGVFLGRGQEALSVAIGRVACERPMFLRRSSAMPPAGWLLAKRFSTPSALISARRSARCAGATAMSIAASPRNGYLPMISHLGAMISVVNGALLARRFKGITGTVGAACIGDGGTSTGAFHEALNQAAVEKLPLVLVVANNQYAYSTPTSRQFACDDLVDKAVGYGVEAHRVGWHRSGGVSANGRRGRGTRARRATARNWSWRDCSGFAATANMTTRITLTRS